MDEVRLEALRREYAERGLEPSDLGPTWLDTFQRWLADAVAAALPEPNAMVVATATTAGSPSVRTVLLKAVDPEGFVFYTNLDSRKGAELRANPVAAALFPWHPLERQVRVEGIVSFVDRDAVQAYFDSRPRPAQLAAWASPQSAVLAGRDQLDTAFAKMQVRFAGQDRIPAPDHWGGVRIAPTSVEFWQGRASRLHDRLRYRHDAAGWVVERLAP
ncbi:MAG: pyridoxamine 5-phosphate oxidase [Frankiales bacterium]|nr:pyridoxamine 5-phosphate oxidase [Frankiales bacterium]